MTFREALAELGIESTASREQARRAYLRLLKTRSPEKDPEAFQRLRAAFEMLNGILRSGPPPGEPERLVADPDPDPDPDPETPDPETPDPETPDPETPDPETPDPETPAANEDTDDDDDAAAESPPESDFDLYPLYRRAAAATQPSQWSTIAAAFDAAAARHDAPSPPIDPALRMLLLLHEANDLHGAANLRRSFEAWLAAHEGGARVMTGATAARWKLVQELCHASADLPPAVRGPIARALLDGDLGTARPALVAFRDANREAAGQASATLHIKAPTIANELPQALYVPTPADYQRLFPQPNVAYRPPSPPRRSFSGWAVLPILLACFALVRVCARTTHTPSYSPPELPPYRPLPRIDYESLRSPLPASPSFLDVRADALRLKIASMYSDDEITRAAQEIIDATLRQDCTDVRAGLDRLRRRIADLPPSSPSTEVGTAYAQLEVRISSVCPP